MAKRVHQQSGEQCTLSEDHGIHEVLGDSAWCGFLDLLERMKMENLERKLTTGKILGLQEEL